MMRLHRLLSFASMCLYVWGTIFRLDHRNEKYSHCEGHFYKGWAHVLLLLKKASADFCCRCHEEKCISIAVFPTLRYVPVLWAYKIGHIGVSDLSEQDFLKNIRTWYISPLAVEDLLRGKLHSLPPQVTSKPSPSTTHVLGGVYHLNVKYMHEVGNWKNTGYIRWLTYHHTNQKGVSFEGALVQNSLQKCKWKWMKVKQLVAILSGVFLAKPIQNLFDHENAGLLNPKGLDEIQDSFSEAENAQGYLDNLIPCVKTMEVKEAERDFSNMTSKPPLTSEMITGTCSALIHRTSAGLKRCLERIIIEKEKYSSSSPLSYFSVSSKPHNARSDHRYHS